MHRIRLVVNIGRPKKFEKIYLLDKKLDKKILEPPKFLMTFLVIDHFFEIYSFVFLFLCLCFCFFLFLSYLKKFSYDYWGVRKAVLLPILIIRSACQGCPLRVYAYGWMAFQSMSECS